MYKCGWNGCEKAYGTLNHLNAHVTMQAHGQKRTPEGKPPCTMVPLFLCFPSFVLSIFLVVRGRRLTTSEFKEIRKEWKARKKEEEAQRKAEEDRQRQAAVTAAATGATNGAGDPNGAQSARTVRRRRRPMRAAGNSPLWATSRTNIRRLLPQVWPRPRSRRNTTAAICTRATRLPRRTGRRRTSRCTANAKQTLREDPAQGSCTRILHEDYPPPAGCGCWYGFGLPGVCFCYILSISIRIMLPPSQLCT